jgi:hypothetical protein
VKNINVRQCIKIPQNVKTQNTVALTNLLTAFNVILDSRIKLGDVVVISVLGVLWQLAILNMLFFYLFLNIKTQSNLIFH